MDEESDENDILRKVLRTSDNLELLNLTSRQSSDLLANNEGELGSGRKSQSNLLKSIDSAAKRSMTTQKEKRELLQDHFLTELKSEVESFMKKQSQLDSEASSNKPRLLQVNAELYPSVETPS